MRSNLRYHPKYTKLKFRLILLLLTCLSIKVNADTASEMGTSENQDSFELEPVIVSLPANKNQSAVAKPVTVLSGDELTLKLGHSIGETLKQELGITSQSFGPGVGTPVIRGQSGPRVRVLQNGIGSNDVSQLSPDHATSIEPIMAERLEVLRGPATLLYGSGAIGGIVNVIDNRIPTHLSSKPVNLSFDQRLDSASNETSTAIKSEGSDDHWAYHLDGLYRDRGDMAIGGNAINVNNAQTLDPTLSVVNNSHGILPNTFAQTLNGSVGSSYITDRGFAGLSFNQFHNNYGIAPDGGLFSENGISYADPNTRIDQRQKKYDFRSDLNDPFSFAEKLSMRLGYTDYFHTELNGGVPGIPYSPGTAFSNKSYEGRFEVTHKPFSIFKGTFGFQAIASQFNAFDFPLGGVPIADWNLINQTITNIVPDTQTQSYGLFGIESFQLNEINYQFGLRLEDTSLNPALNGNYTAPYNLHSVSTASYAMRNNYNFLPISASASAIWKLNTLNTLNIGITRSQRAPQVQELFSNGYHDATRSYELGNPNIEMETSYNFDVGYKFKSDWMRAEIDLYNNWFNNYIYQQRTGEFVTPGFEPVPGQSLAMANSLCQSGNTNGACTPVTASMQSDAIFRGFESKLVFPVLENKSGILDLTLFSDYTKAEFIATGGSVPRMPPLRLGFALDYTDQAWSSQLRFTQVMAQNHPGANDTSTSGYELLNINTQYQIQSFLDCKIMLFMKGNNLLNENIRNSVSFLRNLAPEPGRGAEIGIRINY